MNFNRKEYSDDELIRLYRGILKPRMIEEKMLILLRQGKVSKWFSGIGQEAISVGSTLALEEDEYILPMHRNLGVFTCRDMALDQLFAQFQGKTTGFTKGRDRSFHFGSNEHHIVGMISHLGPQLSVAGGIALADLLENREKVTLVYSGDGGASEGDFHEALNVAAVWNLPVIFMIENNGYGLSTPSNEQFKFNYFIDKGPAYGMDALQIDGNNVLEVYDTVRQAAYGMRKNPRPMLIEAMTFRMRGHEEASGTKYVPQELFEKWAKKDPVENFEKYLLDEKVLTPKSMAAIREEFKAEIEQGLDTAFNTPMPTAKVEEEVADMFEPFEQKEIKPASDKTTEKRFVDAISDGLRQSMERYPELVLMGQDIAEYGGVFKITEGFVEKFGKERVRNTPLCESAIVGIGLGMSIKKKKTMVEMQFADFVTCGFNQIVNNLAKSHYRWAQNADVVVRMPTGAGAAAGPFHSQSNEAWFFHTPGLKIVYPSNPVDAKGLLNAAIEDPNPVMYFEHKMLYRSISGNVPDDYYTTEIGKAALAREGDNFSVITYGMGVHWATQLLEKKGLSADVLDLRTLLPWDKDAVRKTVEKTGRVIVLHEDTLTGGIGGEISAWIAENCLKSWMRRYCAWVASIRPFRFRLRWKRNSCQPGVLRKRWIKCLLIKLVCSNLDCMLMALQIFRKNGRLLAQKSALLLLLALLVVFSGGCSRKMPCPDTNKALKQAKNTKKKKAPKPQPTEGDGTETAEASAAAPEEGDGAVAKPKITGSKNRYTKNGLLQGKKYKRLRSNPARKTSRNGNFFSRIFGGKKKQGSKKKRSTTNVDPVDA